MIKKIEKEYIEEGNAIKEAYIYFLGILIYKCKFTTTNRDIIKNLSVAKEHKQVKGFKINKKNENQG